MQPTFQSVFRYLIITIRHTHEFWTSPLKLIWITLSTICCMDLLDIFCPEIWIQPILTAVGHVGRFSMEEKKYVEGTFRVL